MIAEGWVDRVTLRPDLPGASTAYTPVEITLRVERLLKGSAPNPLTFVDPRSAVQLPDGTVLWGGASGACGILDADPTGQYALIVFRRDTESRLTVNRIDGASFGNGPDALRVRELRQRITAQLRPGLPNTGRGGARVDAPLSWNVGIGLVALVVLGGTSIVRRRRQDTGH